MTTPSPEGVPLIDRACALIRQRGPMAGAQIADALRPHATAHFTRAVLLEAVISGRLVLTADLRLTLHE